ncbi:MAG: amidase [Microcoleaceae cyanobacterium]
MNSTDLALTSALEQAQLIRSRQVSPLELTEMYLSRIEQFNPQLGSYFTVMADAAIAQAQAQTEQLTQPNQTELPPFLGVPISIKDLNPVAGVRCTYGCKALMQQEATYDDGVVKRIRQAGFIILGKTATSEVGSLPYTEPEGFPPARNPWNLDYTAGGSSGGAAAAVAAGLCAVAQGSDGGGSVRGPAFCCGLVGIKPSRGRVSHAPVGDYQNGISTNGPIARTVADAAALLDVMAGYMIGDPYWLPNPEVSFLESTQQPLKPLRIAMTTTVSPVGQATEDCAQAVQQTAQRLAAMGHEVESACPDFADLIDPFVMVWRSGVGASGIPKEGLTPMNRWLAEQPGSAGEYLRAVSQMQVIARRIVQFFEHYDVLLLPTYMHSAIRVGEYADLSPEETVQRMINWIAPCPPFNASGQPAIALPTGLDAKGLPVGVQLVGRPAAETTLIALAAQLEAQGEINFKDCRPALFSKT